MIKNAKRLGVLVFLFCMVCALSGCGRARVVSPTEEKVASGTGNVEKVPAVNEPKVKQETAQAQEVDVRFVCPVLEQLVRTEIGKPSGAISSTDMQELWEIRANGEQISSLQGMELLRHKNRPSLDK